MDEMNPLLTTAEAADHIGLPVGRLIDWRRKGRVGGPSFVRVGRRIYYRVADLDRWLQRTIIPVPYGRGRRLHKRPRPRC